MTNTELALNMLAESATTELSKEKDPQHFEEHAQIAQQGGKAAGEWLGTFGDLSVECEKRVEIGKEKWRELKRMEKEEILQAISTKVKQIMPNGSRVILFGSQARGDAREDSNIPTFVKEEE